MAGRLNLVPQTRPPVGVNLMGDFTLTGTASIPPSAGGQRLITYLALRGRTCRHTLAGTLWPDTTEGHALGSLRTVLWRLRGIDRDLIMSSADDLWLGVHVRVDVHALLATIRTILHGQYKGPAVPPAELVQGDLLPAWRDDWLLIEQERVRQLRLHALEALARTLAAERSYELSLRAGAAAIQIEPLRESAHRVVIDIHLRRGDMVRARRAFEDYRHLLHAQLGLAPSPQLRTLVATKTSGPRSHTDS